MKNIHKKYFFLNETNKIILFNAYIYSTLQPLDYFHANYCFLKKTLKTIFDI